MAGKLKERASIKGGTIEGCDLIDNAVVIVEEDTARLPAHYRSLAVAAGDDYIETKRIARATISGPGTAVAGKLKTRAPVDTDEPVVQRYVADDGEWRRKSTNESAWSGWVKQVDTGKAVFAAIEEANRVNADSLPTQGYVSTKATSTAAIAQYAVVFGTEVSGTLRVTQCSNSIGLIVPLHQIAFGIAKQAAAGADVEIEIVREGPIYNVAWSWTPDLPIFCSVTGTLTQTCSDGMVAYMRVGHALSADMILVRIEPELFRPTALTDRLGPLVTSNTQPSPRLAGPNDSAEMADAANFYSGSIASASSIELVTGRPANVIGISGFTDITDMGGSGAKHGIMRWLIFGQNGGSLIHSAGLLLPGTADIKWRANDIALMMKVSTGWKCVIFYPCNRLVVWPGSSPNAPAAGWQLFCDSGDSNKLKAIASNGTTVTLGTP